MVTRLSHCDPRSVSRAGFISRAGSVVVALVVSLAGCSVSPAAPAPTAAPTAVPASTAVPAPASSYIFGQITAQNGSIWTVRGIRGNVYTVTVTHRTDFGTLFHQRTRDEFKVGDNVRIAGIFSGTAVTANAIDFSKRSGSSGPTG
jgi:hypothetical protein